ncbi:hypothetical protein A0H81_05356 [Grifola frondosa]|uniref:Uncharacterized protein n=1 Tax=Grifola frondosa TaxID=5627 RepID=A0A1C7MHQ1_GRIFR|nr:hypothetical protein A0H81_05356 [Grifola frondosa]
MGFSSHSWLLLFPAMALILIKHCHSGSLHHIKSARIEPRSTKPRHEPPGPPSWQFRLPGLGKGRTSMMTAPTKMMLSAAVAYSHQFNRRRLELPLYALWNQVAQHLTKDLKPLLVMPQYLLYSSDLETNPNDSLATIAGHPEDGESVPDFGIIRTSFHWKDHNAIIGDKVNPEPPSIKNEHIIHWDSIQIDNVTIPVLFEVKRAPPRHLSADDFHLSLTEMLLRARKQLSLRVKLVFTDHNRTHQTSVILVAVSGEWWQWRLVKRRMRRNGG